MAEDSCFPRWLREYNGASSYRESSKLDQDSLQQRQNSEYPWFTQSRCFWLS